jgi:nucleotide-binding universal stress UspA family protein
MRIGEAVEAEIHLLRIANPGVDVQQERKQMAASVESIVGDYARMHYLVKQSDDDVTASLTSVMDDNNPDLVIIGASHEYRIRNFLFGSIPDVVADHAQCSVLMVRRHLLMRGRKI